MYRSTSKTATNSSTNNHCEQNKYNCSNSTKLHSYINKEFRSKSSTQKSREHSITHNTRNSEIHIESNALTLGNENNQTSQSSTSSCYGSTPVETPKCYVYGPALPPPNNHEQNLKTKVYGPTLPSHMTNVASEASLQKKPTTNNDQDETQNLIDVFPSDETNTQVLEDECFGPLPLNIISQSEAHIALEERALQIKLDQLQKGKQDHVSREEWMLELPEIHSKHLALGPRQFRTNPGPDLSDRSSWTNIPSDKVNQKPATHEKLPDLKDKARKRAQEQYDKEQEVVVKKHKKHKKEKSLLEIHQSNLKKQKKGESSVRRPFSREIDLKVNHFDNAQKE
ncbi:hypothetical protein AMK59_7671, partial [Oryctes borbonicus]